MGDIADMMLDGSFCEGCCTPIGDGQSPGYPRYHRACNPSKQQPARPTPPKIRCPICNRKFGQFGLADHMKAKHEGAQQS